MKIFIYVNVLIIAILIIRIISNGRVSRRFQYGLWLSIPLMVILANIFSIPVTRNVTRDNWLKQESKSFATQTVENYNENHTVYIEDAAPSSHVSDSNSVTNDNQVKRTFAPAVKMAQKQLDYGQLIRYGYVFGIVMVALYFAVSNIVFAIRIRSDRRFVSRETDKNIKVYRSCRVQTPFLYGRAIYIPEDLSKSDVRYRYVILHESGHYKQLDYIWVIVESVFLALFWFDPLMWIAFVLVKRDAELSVDEIIVSSMNDESRISYGETLVSFVSQKKSHDKFIPMVASISGRGKSFMRKRIINIRNQSRKSVALSIVISMILAVIVGCSTTDITNAKAATFIEEDTPWYSFTRLSYMPECDSQYLSALFVSPEYKVFTRDDMESSGFENRSELVIYEGQNTEGRTLNTDTVSLDRGEHLSFGDFFVFDSHLYVLAIKDSYNMGMQFTVNEIYRVDMDTMSLEDGFEVSFGGNYYNSASVYRVKVYDDTIQMAFSYQEPDDGRLKFGLKCITGGGADVFEVTTESEVQEWITEDTDIIYMTYIGFDYVFRKINLSTMNIEDYEIPEGMNECVKASSFFTNDSIYFFPLDYLGICKCDFYTGEESIFLDFNNCDVNLSELLLYGSISYMDEDTIILEKNGFKWYEPVNGSVLCELKLADNPNIGKTIITAASMEASVSEIEGEGVLQFNRNNEEYFIKVITDYCPSYYSILNDYDSQFETEIASLSSRITMNDHLRRDIVDGIGPDLVFDVISNPIMNSSECFVDLSTIISPDSGFDRDDYFYNVFDAYTNDGCLYHMPLSYSISGIYTCSDGLRSNGNGLTFEQLEYAISNNWNGFNPYDFQRGRDGYLGEAVSNIYADIIGHDGLLDFDNDNFRSICEFAADRVVNPIHAESPEVELVDIGALDAILSRMVMKPGWSLYGMPTVDGRGPSIASYYSVGVTTCAINQDVCLDFVNLLLEDDVQSVDCSNSLNVSVLDSAADELIDNINSYISRRYGIDNYYDISIIDEYKNIIYSGVNGYYCDEIVMLVLKEEIQSYYAGDRDIDSLIEIINNRCNNMIEERRIGDSHITIDSPDVTVIPISTDYSDDSDNSVTLPEHSMIRCRGYVYEDMNGDFLTKRPDGYPAEHSIEVVNSEPDLYSDYVAYGDDLKVGQRIYYNPADNSAIFVEFEDGYRIWGIVISDVPVNGVGIFAEQEEAACHSAMEYYENRGYIVERAYYDSSCIIPVDGADITYAMILSRDGVMEDRARLIHMANNGDEWEVVFAE